MVEKLFDGKPPRSEMSLLDPGCGTGAFIKGVLRWAQRTGSPAPRITGVDSDSSLLQQAEAELGSMPGVTLVESDFLHGMTEAFDYIIGNPPYVSITSLTASERDFYRQQFSTASGRFDLYTLFFEQALRLLAPKGRLVFITPEKFTYVQSAARLRQQLTGVGIQEITFLSEDTFADLVTYPVVTTIQRDLSISDTRVFPRQGEALEVSLPTNGSSWLPHFNRHLGVTSSHTLSDAFLRISCGVATGADQIYVVKNADLSDAIRPFAYPTLSGRSLVWGKDLATTESMLVPYAKDGSLLPEDQLGSLGEYLQSHGNRERLMQRTCTARKPWYAFHETPPLPDILRPKILCKDIAATPRFVVDLVGGIVPRHSVYYLVPTDASRVEELCAYLNSDAATTYLKAHCQRAANGFFRLQSHVLKQIPLPTDLAPESQLVCA